MLMSRLLSSEASMMSSAQMRLASSSSTCWPRKMIRCRSSRWNTCSPNGITGASATRASATRASAMWAATMRGTASSDVTDASWFVTGPLPGPAGASRRGSDTSLTWSPAPLHISGSLSVTITLSRDRFVRLRPLFAVGARDLFGGVLGGVALVAGRGVHLGGRGLQGDLVPGLVGDLGAPGDDVHRLGPHHVRRYRAELAAFGELAGQPVGLDPHPVGLLGGVVAE